MKLYYSPGVCSLAPHILLRETGLPYDLIRVDLASHKLKGQDDYYAINPKGSVPVLELFAPCRFAAGGMHGLEVRLPDGDVFRPAIDHSVLDRARRWLQLIQKENRGLVLEDKGAALAMHYRLAPRMQHEVAAAMEELVEELGEGFVLRPGKCVLEIMPRGFSERSAIELFMKQRQFAGRTPVFVGDDPTDEVGFEAVNEMGGHSIRVGDLANTAARFRFSSVSTVVAWLRDRNLNR